MPFSTIILIHLYVPKLLFPNGRNFLPQVERALYRLKMVNFTNPHLYNFNSNIPRQVKCSTVLNFLLTRQASVRWRGIYSLIPFAFPFRLLQFYISRRKYHHPSPKSTPL